MTTLWCTQSPIILYTASSCIVCWGQKDCIKHHFVCLRFWGFKHHRLKPHQIILSPPSSYPRWPAAAHCIPSLPCTWETCIQMWPRPCSTRSSLLLDPSCRSVCAETWSPGGLWDMPMLTSSNQQMVRCLPRTFDMSFLITESLNLNDCFS